MTGHLAVETEDLGRIFKRRGVLGTMSAHAAIEDVTIAVRRGEVFGLLGPNGAGKTTLLNVLTTRLLPTSGRARVAGFDVGRYGRWVRPRIGVVPAIPTPLDSFLSVGDSLRLSARRRGVNVRDAERRIPTLLDAVGMTDWHGARSAHLSSGLRQRLEVVRGVLHAPVVLFIDQPARDLDANAGPAVRQFLKHWKNANIVRSIVLATNDLHEAEELCDRVAIIDRGRVVACDTPGALKGRVSSGSRFGLETAVLGEMDVRTLTAVAGVQALAHRSGDRGSVLEILLERDQEIAGVLVALTQRGIDLIALSKRVTTLRDAFVALVGHQPPVEESACISP